MDPFWLIGSVDIAQNNVQKGLVQLYSNTLSLVTEAKLAQPCTSLLPTGPSTFLVGSGAQLLLFAFESAQLVAKSVKLLRSPIRSLFNYQKQHVLVGDLHGISVWKVQQKVKLVASAEVAGGVLSATELQNGQIAVSTYQSTVLLFSFESNRLI